MAETVLQHRITPPRPNPAIIHRTELINSVKKNSDRKLILIFGAAGSGKTTLIRDFLEQTGREYAWLNLSPQLNGFYKFTTYTVHSFKKIKNDFGENTLRLIDSFKESDSLREEPQRTIHSVMGTLINEICSYFNHDLFYVIEDLHELEIDAKNEYGNRNEKDGNGGWLPEMLAYLLENLPENIHLVITTRTKPMLKYSQLAAKRELFEIGENQLRFSSVEISALLNDLYSISHTEEDIGFLLDRFGGWVTGIHLILQAYGRNFREAGRQKLMPESIYDYFAYVIFESLENRIRDFLLKTSLLENFTPEICDGIMDIRHSRDIINELRNKNIFIHTGEGYYNYQSLFKNFLTSKLHESKSPEEIKSLLRKISDYFVKKGDFVSAITYFLEAKDYKSAVPLILNKGQFMINESRLETLWNWLSQIPESMFSEHPVLTYFKGWLYKYHIGDFRKSLEIITGLIKTTGFPMPRRLLIDCYATRTDTLLKLGQYEEAVEDLNELLKTDIEELERAELMYTLASAYFRFDRYEDALDLLTESLKIIGRYKTESLKVNILRLLGTIYLSRGEFIISLYYYEQTADRIPNVHKNFITVINLIILYSESGEYDKALSVLNKASGLLRMYPAALPEINFLQAAAYFRLETGDYEECVKVTEQMKQIAEKNNLKNNTYVSYMTLSEAYYYLDREDIAANNCEFATFSMDPKNEAQKVSQDFLKAIIFKKSKPVPTAEKIFLDAYKYYDEHKSIYNKTQAAYHLADYYLKTGKQDASAKYLEEALKTCEDKQYLPFLEREFLDNKSIFDFAVQKDIHKEFLKKIFERVTNKTGAEFLSDKCKKRLALQIDNLYDIRMDSLGTFELKVRGRIIPEKAWSRKSAKLMLAYLLLNRHRILSKDELVDFFFRDLPPQSAENSFHQAIANIRSAVKSTGLVLYDNRTLKLNEDGFYRTDCREFESLYQSGNSSSDTGERKSFYSRAAALYRGEFLPGAKEEWCIELREKYSRIYDETRRKFNDFG